LGASHLIVPSPMTALVYNFVYLRSSKVKAGIKTSRLFERPIGLAGGRPLKGETTKRAGRNICSGVDLSHDGTLGE